MTVTPHRTSARPVAPQVRPEAIGGHDFCNGLNGALARRSATGITA
ncbi:hypothetical protein [Ostreiculturibacter nitratireducens]